MPLIAATQDAIEDAARILRAGGLVAFPTETVYGLGALATDDQAVARIFAAKERPRINPLICHVANLDMVVALAVVTDQARALADAFWPGALTLVLERRSDCPASELVSAGLGTIAVRVPAHPVAQALIKAAGAPIAAPSANRSEELSPTEADHVEASLGTAVDMILDDGPCALGLESTVIGLFEGKALQLRPGAIPRAEIERVVGPLSEVTLDAAHSPGQMARHYAPNAALRLNATKVNAGEALLAFGQDVPAHDGPVLNLSEHADLVEAAANLFSYLRKLDSSDASAIAVMPIPEAGLGEAINDRLARAAAPKEVTQ